MRSLDELLGAVLDATNINNASALQQCAVELAEIGTPEALAAREQALGTAEFSHGSYQQALEHYHRSIALNDDLGITHRVAITNNSIGFVHTTTGNFPEAMNCYQQALTLFEELGDRIAIAQSSANIGIVHRCLGNNALALEHYNRTLALYEELDERYGVASVMCSIGNVHLLTGNYADALTHYHRSLALYQELGNKKYVANNMSNIGHVFDATENYPEALEQYHRAMEMYEELGDRNGVANSTGSIGNVLFTTGNNSKALENFEFALSLHTELGNRNGIVLNCSNIGTLYQSTGDYTTALEYFRRALALNEELGARTGIVASISNIIITMISMESYTDAEALLATLDTMMIDDPRVDTSRDRSRAAIQIHNKNFDVAMQTLQSALSITQKHSLRSEQAEIHKELRDLCEKRNDFAGYIEHNNEYTRINEEINGKDTTTKLATQEKQREIDAREREHAKQLAVLHSTLPKHIADRVARGETVNDHYENATVMFLDIVGFTTLSSTLTSQQVSTLLDAVFAICDDACKRNNVTRIKTIGDSYLAFCE